MPSASDGVLAGRQFSTGACHAIQTGDCFFDVISSVRESSRAGGPAFHYFICSCPGIFRSASSYRLHEPTTCRFKHLSGVFYNLFCSFSVLFGSSHLTKPHFLPAFQSIPPTRTGTVNPQNKSPILLYIQKIGTQLVY